MRHSLSLYINEVPQNCGKGVSLSAMRSNRSAAWRQSCSLPLQVVEGYNEYLDSNNRSLWFFTPENPVRRLCTRVTGNPWFGRVVLTLVLASCVVMALDDPGCKDACKQEAVLSKVWEPWERCLGHVLEGWVQSNEGVSPGSRASAVWCGVPGAPCRTVNGFQVHRRTARLALDF